MGFPSDFSDTSWMYRREHGDPLTYILSVIEERARRGEHMPLMLHDWVAGIMRRTRRLAMCSALLSAPGARIRVGYACGMSAPPRAMECDADVNRLRLAEPAAPVHSRENREQMGETDAPGCWKARLISNTARAWTCWAKPQGCPGRAARQAMLADPPVQALLAELGEWPVAVLNGHKSAGHPAAQAGFYRRSGPARR